MNAKKIRLIILLLVVVSAITTLVLRGRGGNSDVIVASGTVEATEALLSFQAPGRIEELTAHEGDSVAIGEVLARLDQSELDARRAAAVAGLAAARATLRELRTGSRSEEIARASASVEASVQRLRDSERDVARSQRLFEGGAISREVLDKHVTARDIATAELERAQQSYELVRQGPRAERISAQTALVSQAQASVAQVDAAIANAFLTAPFAGLITVRHREPGEVVAPGSPVVTLMNPNERWVRVYVLEPQVGRISLGQEVSMSADSYEDRRYTGVISYISNSAEFTPRNVQTPQERVKLVYEVKVRITGDSAFDLKPGLAADVTINTPGFE